MSAAANMLGWVGRGEKIEQRVLIIGYGFRQNGRDTYYYEHNYNLPLALKEPPLHLFPSATPTMLSVCL